MTPAIAWAFIKGLPWRWIGAAALIFGVWMHGYSFASNRADKAVKAIRAECVAAAKDAQDKADARLADQREKANSAVSEALLTADEYKIKLQARQNDLRKTTANLASCRLAVDTVRLLNAARTDAIGKD